MTRARPRRAPGDRAGRAGTPSRAPPPLVGRRAWEALVRKHVAGTEGRLVVWEGEAIGKTRLAEEFVAHARVRGKAWAV